MKRWIWPLIMVSLMGCSASKGVLFLGKEIGAAPDLKNPATVLILNSGLVHEFPRNTFERGFSDEKALTTALGQQLKHLVPELTPDRLRILETREEVNRIKQALRDHFKKDPEGRNPIQLPPDLVGSVNGPLWVFSDWEYHVESHVRVGGAHLRPGGAANITDDYAYFEIELWAFALDEDGRMTRYAKGSARSKFNPTVRSIPFHVLLRNAAEENIRLLKGGRAGKLTPTLPSHVYRR